MRSISLRQRVATLVWAATLIGSPVYAQASSGACPAGAALRPSIGVTTFQCAGGRCQVPGSERVIVAGARIAGGISDAPADSYRFTTEPTLLDIDPYGPAASALRSGDVLVSVGGDPITSGAAARTLSEMREGDVLNLTVQREGQPRAIRLTVGSACGDIRVVGRGVMAVIDGEVWTTSPGTPRRATDLRTCGSPGGGGVWIVPVGESCGEAPGRRMSVELHSAGGGSGRGVALTLGRVGRGSGGDAPIVRMDALGMVLSAAQELLVGANGAVAWQFREVPVITEVTAEGAAARAGLAVGDRIISIGGALVTSPEASQALSGARTGSELSVVVETDGEARTIVIRPTVDAAG